ncbi:MAG: ribosome silencing factor [Proteobacteria bacterium]|nr:ribosome silencing factor [Pseudomonadota bacterium]
MGLSRVSTYHNSSFTPEFFNAGEKVDLVTRNHLSSDEILNLSVSALLMQKALDIRAIDISYCSDVSDVFLIASGTSERHVKGIADRVVEELSKKGERPTAVNGYQEGEWVLVDFGSVIVHVFYEPMRQFYGLDELWAKKGNILRFDADTEKEIRQLRTGIDW